MKTKSPATTCDLIRAQELLTEMLKDATASQKRLNDILSFTRKLATSATLTQAYQA
jgi:hypothetical protein